MPAVAANLEDSDGSLDVTKSDEKVGTIVRHSFGPQPIFSFTTKPTDNPLQWVQLLHALDQQGVSSSFAELPGWPLLYPVKVQLQKCDKCPREFCSSINYRRHVRVHHRLKNLDKDSRQNRDLLGAYWDKLSVEEAMEVVSLKDEMLEGVPASLILDSLTTLIHRAGFSPLPHYYLRAGAALLEIFQSKPSRFPLSSQDLFTILDDASEKTCLCGAAVSMQRYVFDGEAGKVGLEPKNLVACTSFLLEQKLVKAWLADKDAEALRCQIQLVEEEEAAQKRQAMILERKRQKKLRQKDQKAREQRHEEDIKGKNDNSVDALSAADTSLVTCDLEAHDPETFTDSTPSRVPSQCPDTNEGMDGNVHSEDDFCADQYFERPSVRRQNRRCTAVARRLGLPKSQWAAANGLQVCQNSPISNSEVIQNCRTLSDQSEATVVNGGKVCSRILKPEIVRMVSEASTEKEPDQVMNREVLIGSISVTLGNCSQSEGIAVASRQDSSIENLANQNSGQDKPMNPDFVQSGNNRLTSKHWRPASWHGTENPVPDQSEEAKADSVYGNGDCQILSDPSCLTSCSTDGSGSDIGFENNLSLVESRVGPGSLRFSSQAAKAFLAQRWEDAMSSDHLVLVVSSDTEPPGCQERQDTTIAECQPTVVDKCNILPNSENWLSVTSKVTKPKPTMKPEKGTKIKYIPKQKTAT